MSTSHSTSSPEPDRIDVIPNEDEGTVTFVADGDGDGSDPPTEWITIDAASTIPIADMI